MSQPRVLITLDTGETWHCGIPLATVEQKAAYGRALVDAGGLPLWVAPSDGADIGELLDFADGLVITGGDFDIAPELYGGLRAPDSRLDRHKPERTRFEARLLQGALDRDRPVLAICGGMQLLAVVLGGTLIQDIGAEIPGALDHEQPTSPTAPHHEVLLEPDGLLRDLARSSSTAVNSTHRQAVDALGRGLEVLGRAEDGVIEAIADRVERRIGVQWHPELLGNDLSRALFEHLVALAGP